MHLSGHSELSPDKILFCVKKATEKVSEMQQIVEKTLKEDEKLRKKGIIPRLSTDIFDDPFDFGYGQEMELDEARGKPDHIFSQCKSLKKSIS